MSVFELCVTVAVHNQEAAQPYPKAFPSPTVRKRIINVKVKEIMVSDIDSLLGKAKAVHAIKVK